MILNVKNYFSQTITSKTQPANENESKCSSSSKYKGIISLAYLDLEKVEKPAHVKSYKADTVDTRNSGPQYSGFACFSEKNCANQLWTYEVNSLLK